MKFHKWILEERDKLAAHAPNPSEAAKVGAALSPPEQKDRRVEGIVIFASSHVLINDVGVRQLGGLASELAKQTAEKAQEQQDVVLKDAQQLNLDSLYRLPTLGTWPPGDSPAEDGPAEDDPVPGTRPKAARGPKAVGHYSPSTARTRRRTSSAPSAAATAARSGLRGVPVSRTRMTWDASRMEPR